MSRNAIAQHRALSSHRGQVSALNAETVLHHVGPWVAEAPQALLPSAEGSVNFAPGLSHENSMRRPHGRRAPPPAYAIGKSDAHARRRAVPLGR